jgi:hypothetical protein
LFKGGEGIFGGSDVWASGVTAMGDDARDGHG